MIEKVIKRDGRIIDFNKIKICNAINLAMQRTEKGVDFDLINRISDSITKIQKKKMSVEEIQDLVEEKLMSSARKDVAKEYITYRDKRQQERMKKTELYKIGQDIVDVRDLDLLHENANLNGESYSGKQSKFGSEYAKWYATNFILPNNVVKAIKNNYLHVHDLDHYAVGNHNCTFIPFGKLLKRGFSTGNGSVRKPNSIETAMQLVAIIFQSQQNCQYGGVAANMIDFDLAPYVAITFKKHFKKILKQYNNFTNDNLKCPDDNNIFIDNENLKQKYKKVYKEAYKETENSVHQGAESLIHNLNTMNSRSGDQVPFTSLNYGTCTSTEGRMVIFELLKTTQEGLGHGETPIFPIQIFKCKKGINQNPEDKNYDLFVKAIETTSKRLYPNFANCDASYYLSLYDKNNPDTEFATMGCRTAVLNDRFGYNYCSGKGNLSFNTLNLVKIGIDNGICLGKRERADEQNFYKILTEQLNVALEGLLHRYKRQCKQKAKSSDFMMREGIWEDGENLNSDDEIGELLKHGTISIGFIGLGECMKAMYGKHHGESKEVWNKAYKVIKYMRDYCDKKSEELNLNISLFATPAEGTSGLFTKYDKKEYGKIKGVTDREYYTNSYHIPVYYNITAFKKIELEAPFHELCNAGAISYIELDGNARNNPQALQKLVQYALKQDMKYFAINHPVDRCPICGYEGIIGNICPSCGAKEENTHFCRIRRVTGYLTGDYQTRFNSAKQAEVRDRVKHGMSD